MSKGERIRHTRNKDEREKQTRKDALPKRKPAKLAWHALSTSPTRTRHL